MSVRHRVEDDVDAERISALLGKLAEEILIFLFALPTVAIVGIVAGDHHHMPFLVEQSPNMHITAFFAVVIFPRNAVVLAVFASPKIRDLETVLGTFQREDTAENR